MVHVPGEEITKDAEALYQWLVLVSSGVVALGVGLTAHWRKRKPSNVNAELQARLDDALMREEVGKVLEAARLSTDQRFQHMDAAINRQLEAMDAKLDNFKDELHSIELDLARMPNKRSH